jgi:ketopantoate reductase
MKILVHGVGVIGSIFTGILAKNNYLLAKSSEAIKQI